MDSFGCEYASDIVEHEDMRRSLFNLRTEFCGIKKDGTIVAEVQNPKPRIFERI